MARLLCLADLVKPGLFFKIRHQLSPNWSINRDVGGTMLYVVCCTVECNFNCRSFSVVQSLWKWWIQNPSTPQNKVLGCGPHCGRKHNNHGNQSSLSSAWIFLQCPASQNFLLLCDTQSYLEELESSIFYLQKSAQDIDFLASWKMPLVF